MHYPHYNKKQTLMGFAGKQVDLDTFSIANGMFTKCNVRAILQAAQQLNINHLGLAKNEHPEIINDLCVFNPWEKLQNLIMPQNLIQSIEAITYINAPLLWRIDFSQNLIINMSPFRKMHCQKLVMFRIGNNHLLDMGQFQTCYCPELMEITIQGNNNLTTINTIFKLQAHQFVYLYAQNSAIRNQNILNCLKNKFNSNQNQNKELHFVM